MSDWHPPADDQEPDPGPQLSVEPAAEVPVVAAEATAPLAPEPVPNTAAEGDSPYGDPPPDDDNQRIDEPPVDHEHDNDADDDTDETVFELNEFAMEQRRHLEMRLTGARIVHRWEVGSDLVVNTSDADAVEGFLDEVENPDAFEVNELDDLSEDVDDEAVYKAMSDLYIAADRLQHAADDPATAGSFHLAADGVAGAPPPFGFDPRLWAQVKELSASVVASLDADADPEVVEQDARTLRQILANYV